MKISLKYPKTFIYCRQSDPSGIKVPWKKSSIISPNCRYQPLLIVFSEPNNFTRSHKGKMRRTRLPKIDNFPTMWIWIGIPENYTVTTNLASFMAIYFYQQVRRYLPKYRHGIWLRGIWLCRCRRVATMVTEKL